MMTFQINTSDPVMLAITIPQEKLNTFHFCSPEEIALKRKYPDSFSRRIVLPDFHLTQRVE